MCSCFCKNLPVVMYKKFRNIPIFKDIPPICPYFLGFRVGRCALALFNFVTLTTRRALSLYKVYGDCTLLMLSGTWLKSVNSLLALRWRYVANLNNNIRISFFNEIIFQRLLLQWVNEGIDLYFARDVVWSRIWHWWHTSQRTWRRPPLSD